MVRTPTRTRRKSIEAQKLEFEREKFTAEKKLRERELAIKEAEAKRNDAQLRIEDKNFWLSVVKWSLGTFALGVATFWVKTSLETRELALKTLTQEHEIEIKNIEQEREFLKAFLSDALDADILARIRLAHYVTTTASDPGIRGRWQTYHSQLRDQCDANTRKYLKAGGAARPEEALEASEVFCNVGGPESLPDKEKRYVFVRNALDVKAEAPVFQFKSDKEVIEKYVSEQGGFQENPETPARSVNFGISLEAYMSLRKQVVTIEEFKALTKEEAAAFYKEGHMKPFEAVNSTAVRATLFTISAWTGLQNAIATAQIVVRTPRGVVLDPETIRRLNASQIPTRLIGNLVCNQIAYSRGLRFWDFFGLVVKNGFSELIGVDADDLDRCYAVDE